MSRLITLFLALASLAGAQSSLFQLLDTPVPTATAVQAVGDVDGDGDQDLLIPDGVMINDGHGRFARMAVASVAFTRQSARLADLTGDGMAELISFVPTTSTTPAHLRIELNAGLFTFVPGSTLVATAPQTVAGFAIGDVDGDGDRDILAGTWTGSMSTPPILWLNDGFGSFTPSPASVPSIPLPSSTVLLTDLDGDGDLDAVFAATVAVAPAQVRVATNTAGTFVLAPSPIWATSVISIAAGRFNLDGLPDLVLGTTTSVVVLLSSPSGFLAPVSTPLPVGAGPPTHAPVDVNGDGIDELLQWTLPRTLALKAVTAGGQIGPTLQVWGDLGLPAYADYSSVARDFDGDGDKDVVTLTDYEPILLMNAGTGAFVRTGGRYAGPSFVGSQNVGDLDADGDLDVLGISTGNTPVIATALSDGDGFWSAGPSSSLPPASASYLLRTFDRDGDGDQDIFLMRQTFGTPGPAAPDLVFDNVNGTFSQIATVPGNGDGRVLRAADFDNDGDLDLVRGRFVNFFTIPGPITFIQNLGAGGFAAPVPNGTSHWTYDVDVADFDGNGTLDFFQTNGLPPWSTTPDTSDVYLNSGGGAFVPVTTGVSGYFTAAADLNGDLMPDLVVDGQVMFNSGGGTFVPGPTLPSALIAPASLVDVDLDGDLDLVETPATVMFNAGGGTAMFGPPQSYLPRVAAATSNADIPESVVVDLDRDGDPDIVAPGPVILMNTTRQIAHGSIARPGRPASIDLYGTPGTAWILWASDGVTSFPFPPLGTVLIDPASAQLFATGTFAPQSAALPGTASVGATVPNNPVFVGWSTWWQAVDAGTLHLTNRINLTVLSF